MKKVIFLFFGIVLSLNVSAQWYSAYGVTNVNELNQEQCNLALQKADKTIKTGKILTFAGVGTSLVGIIVYSSAIKDVIDSDDLEFGKEINKGTFGAIMMYGGGIAAGIGIPVWISGESQKSQIEIALKKFDTAWYNKKGYPIGVGIKVTF